MRQRIARAVNCKRWLLVIVLSFRRKLGKTRKFLRCRRKGGAFAIPGFSRAIFPFACRNQATNYEGNNAMTQNASHTQRELLPSANYLLFFMSNRARFPKRLRQAIKHRWALILFLWSSSLWEAFNIGQCLAKRGISPDGFRKSRGFALCEQRGPRPQISLRRRYMEANR
jgi:hypothetical protein